MKRFFLTINRFFYRKNRTGKLRFLSLFVSNIRVYYVNVVSLVGEGSVVSFSKQRDRSGAVREKEIKNELGTNNVSERRSRTKKAANETNDTSSKVQSNNKSPQSSFLQRQKKSTESEVFCLPWLNFLR